ncbi:MAG TPA: SufD family Fe-S cluster assembly protein, partial [Nitriliruptorales bacterium]
MSDQIITTAAAAQRELSDDLGTYKFGWHDPDNYVFEPKRGLSREVVEEISFLKGEPEWMRKLRLRAYEAFLRRPMPNWGGDISGIHFDDIYYFVRATEKQATSWEDLPDDIKNTYDRLGIPEAEKQRLVSGVAAQYESEVVYHKIREDLEQKGVLFLDTDTALREHEDLFREHFTKVIPANDNKFAALNTAVWSGGSFIWIPEGVKVDVPLQAYFRINKENMGQFERTLIIAEPGSYIHYVEGCLPTGELVGTADGDWRPIEQIQVGDKVLGHDGRPHRVTAIQVRDHRGPVHTFTPISPENAFRVTGEHPLLVVRREDVRVKRQTRNGWKPEVDTSKLLAATPEWVEAADVVEGDFLVFPKPRPTPASTVLPLEFARLAGYYLADGSASLVNGHKALQFSLHIDDNESIEEIRRLTKELYDADGSVFWNDEKHEARVLVYTKAGYEALRTHVGTRSHTKALSPELFAQDETFLRNLVATYLRGDGNLTQRHGARWYRAHTTSRTWARQLQAIVARLGTYATVSIDRPGGPGEILGRQVTRRDLYRVQWTEGGHGPREVRDAGDHFLVPIKSIGVADFDGQVHNLDVEEPDSYLAGGFAVHNCTAPIYSSDSLHSAVVEIIAKPGSRVRYTTIQNWSTNVYNLVTKRAAAYEDATMEWVDGNIGCLAQGSLVTTPSGPKPIEELTPGEDILSFDHDSGQLVWRQVTAKRYSGEQPVREVRVGERRLHVTDNHPFLGFAGVAGSASQATYVRADALAYVAVPASAPMRAVSGTGGTATLTRAQPASLEVVAPEVSGHLGTVPTWDIEVEGTGNFVAEGFIVHNSKLTMKYPAVWLMGRGAKGEVLSVAYANDGQHQDAGAKMVHHASDTTSNIVSKSISKGTGRTTYRGLVQIDEGAKRTRAAVKCDALMLDDESRSDTYPYMEIEETDATVEHEATVSKVSDDQLFYMQSRGIDQDEAMGMIVRGFIEPIARELPMEYAV